VLLLRVDREGAERTCGGAMARLPVGGSTWLVGRAPAAADVCGSSSGRRRRGGADARWVYEAARRDKPWLVGTAGDAGGRQGT
jgi:hypothetical protein